VYAHNIETVERLQKRVRDYRAGYRQRWVPLQFFSFLLLLRAPRGWIVYLFFLLLSVCLY
jgi:hypothetical protein